MVNHIQTLMLNTSASAVEAELDRSEYGYIDPKFHSVPLDKHISDVYSRLFSGTEGLGLSCRLARVKSFMPYFSSPECSRFIAVFDQRTTCIKPPPTSVVGFYLDTQSNFRGLENISGIVSSPDAVNAFLPTGTGSLDSAIESMKKLYSRSEETPVMFGTVLFAVAVHLESSRLRSLA